MTDFDFGAEYAAFGDDLKGAAYEGTYTMQVKNMQPGTTGKGKAMFTVTLAFTDGPLKAKNKTVVDKLYWSPESDQSARIFAAALRIMGASQEWIMADRPSALEIAQRCIGNLVEVNLKPDEFNGQPTTRVNYRKTVSSGGGAAPAGSKSTAAAQAVSLDEDEPVAAEEPVGASSGSSNPWG